jgi:hypothetical protein
MLIQDRICRISYLTKDSNNNDIEQYQPDLGLLRVPINIQPASAEDTILSDGTFAQTWIGFTAFSGVRSGGLLTISGANLGDLPRNMIVKGIENWDQGDLPHYEMTLIEFMEGEVS